MENSIDPDEVDALRDVISGLEKELSILYRRRLAIILDMVAIGCSRRAIGAYWSISNPRVTQMVNRHLGKYQ